MKALVTGGRGFIGSFLVESLIQNGYEIRCLLREESKGLGWLDGLNIRPYWGEITDPTSLTSVVKEVDYIFHLAGMSAKLKNIKEFYRVNVNGTKNLLETTRKYNSDIKRFVFVSTLAAIGPNQNMKPLTESDPPRPVSHYGRSKLKAEQITLEFSKDLPVTIIRPPSVYGPRDRNFLSYFKFTKQGLRFVLTGGPRYSSFIYVKDLVQGIVLAAEKGEASGQIYNISDDQPYSWEYFGDVIVKVLDVDPRKVKVPLSFLFFIFIGFELYLKIKGYPTLLSMDKYRELKQVCWTCDNSKAKNELGFKSQFSIEEGLRETYKWYKHNGWI